MPALGLETRRSSCKVNPNPLPFNINTRHFHHKQPFALQMGTGPTLALWWPLFLAMKFTFLLLNLAEINIFILKSAYGGDPPVLELFLKNSFFSASLS